jgi:transcriptional repressor NrdR
LTILSFFTKNYHSRQKPIEFVDHVQALQQSKCDTLSRQVIHLSGFFVFETFHSHPLSFPLDFLTAQCQYVVMVCLYCSQATQVVNSRLQKRANQVWRRRKCLACAATFTTHEIADLGSALSVRASTADISSFSRDKLFVSIYESCKHRASALDDATQLTLTIISFLLHEAIDGLVERQSIITASTRVLERFDKTAATMYAAYHK